MTDKFTFLSDKRVMTPTHTRETWMWHYTKLELIIHHQYPTEKERERERERERETFANFGNITGQS